ncbi:ACT domain-containing protein [Methanopyrus kandleri]|uniref:Predicted allosteric regulator of homoserine dehydrogenase containing an ACT domain n=2 Tax=Methanopyrus kandleri TaxID=2320 RepID=Q8TV47_METKA|nr:ACT domain-containing protein [Methanopyrus kandleri]AAM02766.1 Predicted allosteric regulator of homoserine dehydrogenase containing an ACT domain [Methanopyrus kandleri AV19]HII71026.1 ACT domain-containing protein [Methanopyrus kandleri]
MKRFELDVVLPDKPGQLVKVLEPLSKIGGNVISISHSRDGDRARVHIVFEATEDVAREYSRRISELEGVKILRFGRGPGHETDVVLIGHIVDTDIKDTIDRVNAIQGARVVDVDLEMPDPERESSAGFTLIYEDEEALRKAVQTIEEIAEEKDLVAIFPVEVIQCVRRASS